MKLAKVILFMFILCSCRPIQHPVDYIDGHFLKYSIENIDPQVTRKCFETYDYCSEGESLDDYCAEDLFKNYYGKCRLLEEWDESDPRLLSGTRITKFKHSYGTLIKVDNVNYEQGFGSYSYYFYDERDYLIAIVNVDGNPSCPVILYGSLEKYCT